MAASLVKAALEGDAIDGGRRCVAGEIEPLATAAARLAVVSSTELLVVGGAVFVAALVQLLSGFGFSLLAVPLMTLAIDTKTAVVVTTLTAVFVTTWQAIALHRNAERALVKRLSIGAYLGMPLGLAVFKLVDENTLQFVLGVAVLVAVVALIADVGLSRVGRRFDYVAGFASGVLNTSLSTNGPPLVIDLQARQLAPAQFRATIVAVFALSNVFGLALFLGSGEVTRDGVTATVVTIPAMIGGQLAGYPIRKHVEGDRFRWLVLALLIGGALSAIGAALL